ncbi:helix-turn-helix domain-containing protein [Paenibacillus phoenicis]|jgi:DNA-binding transcriptional ArsR family regulator|uniref:Helix-turn-helix domain-containing protein n=1 Tax=Paenibacillus phoenicis TaxID=554117 RepID=A0ABU5PFG5_9BACL|nr:MULTISPECIES: ArsR family transcriptional regulator [Paenibacillus]EES71805.1 transcriptional regulator, ArsR family [Paenibacillus sp. oral taxon 786 str. D14]MCT2193696.1 helix-turn-helix domain-containing protein [Paenibacillus sp. p3-SID1389]MDU0330462.1 helix-turn-helix domain-containing protein [Paenibacillus sp. 3LSP]MEA3568502.1 helix-turn-helix domain-containing protein [Paenibacillus phoenicis]
MKVLYHPERDEIQLSSVLYALSDPIRLSVVAEMRRCGEQPCNYFEVPIAKSTLSHHIRTLREAGVISTRIQGTQRFISLREVDLESRFPGLLTSILEAYEKTEHKELNVKSK